MNPNDETLVLLEETDAPTGFDAEPWPVLMVDDDEQVHAATRFALQGVRILGRSLMLHQAYSAGGALAFLSEHPDIAVLLLDVVMENEHAGLDLVREIRQDLKMSELRIILRTGQPGHAPEMTVIEQYDINDYRTKNELTHNRLIASLTVALRSYEQIRALAYSRRGLEKIVHAAADLTERHALASFAEGVLLQLAGLLHLPPDGVLCVQRGSVFAGETSAAPSPSELGELYVVGATGQLSRYINAPLVNLGAHDILERIHNALLQRGHYFGDTATVLYLREDENEAAVYLKTGRPLAPLDRQLLSVFAANIAAGYENVSLIQRLQAAAYVDPLTRLPNRSQFLSLLQKEAEAPPADGVLALLDLNHFTDVNDGLGLEVGNQLLQAVAQRLAGALPESVLARIGGDVFALLGPASELAPERLQSLFDTQIPTGEHWLPLTVTLGLCSLQHGAGGAQTLLQYANIALNLAKKAQHSHVWFSPDMEEQTRWRLEMIRRLRHDFGERQLEVWYQPQLSLPDGRVTGLEALLRWPGSGMVSPAVFVPLAEYSGLIVEIGDWVLEVACQALRQLEAVGYGSLRMAVNVSVPQFRSHGFVERINATLKRHELAARRLELEVTESILMDDPERITDSLRQLQQRGVTLAIDDFGTGFSSLSYLQQLPIDRLKIDRSFINELEQGKGQAIAETIIALCRKLKLKAIAEGVETDAQRQALIELGCDEAQGFYYSKPLPLPALQAWLLARQP